MSTAGMQVDVLVMKHFLSGFSDADAEVILKHCREVLTSDGKILLLQVQPPVHMCAMCYAVVPR